MAAILILFLIFFTAIALRQFFFNLAVYVLIKRLTCSQYNFSKLLTGAIPIKSFMKPILKMNTAQV